MSEIKIQCPFCKGTARVKKNARLDPFISCPRCGPINARGAMYRQYIEEHQVIDAGPNTPNEMPKVAKSNPGKKVLEKTEVARFNKNETKRNSKPVIKDNKSDGWLNEW